MSDYQLLRKDFMELYFPKRCSVEIATDHLLGMFREKNVPCVHGMKLGNIFSNRLISLMADLYLM
jgi:hypothetical protein